MKKHTMKEISYECLAKRCKEGEPVRTGFSALDDIIYPGNLVLISAVQAMGKTSLLLSILNNIAEEDDNISSVLVLDPYDDRQRFAEAFLSLRTGIPRGEVFKANSLTKLADELYRLSKKDISVFDGSHTENELLSIFDTDADVIFIDGLHMTIPAVFDDPTEERLENSYKDVNVLEVLKHIKKKASETKKTVFATIYHPKEAAYNYPDKRQRIEDLRIYGKGIEDIVDLIIFPFRSSYYVKADPRLADLVVIQNGGGRSIQNVEWDPATCRFTPMDRDRFYEITFENNPGLKEKYELIFGQEDATEIEEGNLLVPPEFVSLDDEDVPF